MGDGINAWPVMVAKNYFETGHKFTPLKIHMSPKKKWLKREMFTPETGKLHP